MLTHWSYVFLALTHQYILQCGTIITQSIFSITLGTDTPWITLNTLRPRENGRRFADDTFKRIFLNENVRISIKISLKFVPKGSITNNPTLVQIMAWRRSGDKPLSETMVISWLTHICVTRPQWVKGKVWGVFWEYKLWFMSYLSYCSIVCNIMLYWTMLQLYLAVYCYSQPLKWFWHSMQNFLESVLPHHTLWYRIESLQYSKSNIIQILRVILNSQVAKTHSINYIPQTAVRCNYLSTP